MPNYDFECQDCHETFEVRATIKEMEEGKISCVKCKLMVVDSAPERLHPQ